MMQSESILTLTESPKSNTVIWMRRFVWKIALATVALMIVGSATRVMNAGLACPDWPLCYGQIIPSRYLLNLQVFLEWFHRADAGLIFISTLALMILAWVNRKKLPKWFAPMATLAFGLIFWQAILGGLTVTQLLRFDIVTAHLGTALLFLTTLVFLATGSSEFQPEGTNRKMFWGGLFALILVYIQSILGGLVASRWAIHQCLAGSKLCQVMNNHLLGVVPTLVAILLVVFFAFRESQLSPLLKKLALSAIVLVVLQIMLGISTLKFELQVEILTVTHHLVAALLLSVLVAFTVLAQRNSKEVKL